MTRRCDRRLFSAAAAAALAVCTRARADALNASGTGTALGAMRQLAAEFEKASPGDKLRILPSVGSSGAVKAVAEGVLDLGFLGRSLSPGEKELGLAVMPYARTPFVFVAGPRSRISEITSAEVARIYRGELAAWPGGERVRLILRPAMDADTMLLRAVSTEMAAAVDAALGREGMLMAGTNQECNEMAARTPGAFAVSTLTQIVTEGVPLTPLVLDGVAPTLANLASGAYPLAKQLLVAFRAPPGPAVRRFLAFLGSPAARRILEETASLPLPLAPVD